MQVGIRRGTAKITRDIGDPTLPEGSYEIGNYFGALVLDSRDTPDFPQSGGVFNFGADRNVKALGSSDDFTQLMGAASKPINFGANTLLFSTDYGVSLETIPAERVFLVGGMFDLSGFQPGGLTASDFFIGRTAYYRELASLGGTFAKLNLFGGDGFEDLVVDALPTSPRLRRTGRERNCSFRPTGMARCCVGVGAFFIA
jgi:hypothetical protein